MAGATVIWIRLTVLRANARRTEAEPMFMIVVPVVHGVIFAVPVNVDR